MLSKWGQSSGSNSVRALFAAGEQGGWWDPSDFSTMYQDSTGTTPVTAVGQPVGLIRDKSGRGNHRTQGTAPSRPTLQQDASGYFYLQYDGVDDFMQTASVNFSATDKVMVSVGVTKLSEAAAGVLVEFSPVIDTNPGAFSLFAPTGAAGNNYRFISRGTGAVVPNTSGASYPSPISNVATGIADIAGPSCAIRVNGVSQTPSVTTQGTGNYGNYPIFFGSRGGTTSPFNGREYQTIIRGTTSTATQIAQAERFVGSRMGIAL